MRTQMSLDLPQTVIMNQQVMSDSVSISAVCKDSVGCWESYGEVSDLFEMRQPLLDDSAVLESRRGNVATPMAKIED